METKGVGNYTERQLRELAHDEENKVYEWTYEEPKASMEPKEAATAFMDIRSVYLGMRAATPDKDDDVIRNEIRNSDNKLIKKFSIAYDLLFRRITDRTVTQQMLDAYKFMLVMKQKQAEGEFDQDSATSLTAEYVNSITVRDATERELATGKVESKMWEGNPLTEKDYEDPLSRAPEPDEEVNVDVTKLKKPENKSQSEVKRDEVQKVIQDLARAANRSQILNAIRRIRRLLEKAPDASVPVKADDLDRAFQMKQSRSTGVWDREVSGLVGRVMRLAATKCRKA